MEERTVGTFGNRCLKVPRQPVCFKLIIIINDRPSPLMQGTLLKRFADLERYQLETWSRSDERRGMKILVKLSLEGFHYV